MARLSDSITYGNHAITGDVTVGGTLTLNGTEYQQVNLTGGSNVTISGTYPNLTISSVNTNTTYSGGTGITLSGTTFSLTDERFTSALSSKLSGIATGAQVNVATNLTNSTTTTTVAVISSTGSNTALPAATTSKAGVMTSADKSKLDGIAAGATVGGSGGVSFDNEIYSTFSGPLAPLRVDNLLTGQPVGGRYNALLAVTTQSPAFTYLVPLVDYGLNDSSFFMPIIFDGGSIYGRLRVEVRYESFEYRLYLTHQRRFDTDPVGVWADRNINKIVVLSA